MLSDLIREFCDENACYEVYENYAGRYTSGERTIGIIVREGQNYFEMLTQLTRYLEEKGFDDSLLELEGVAVDELGQDVIVYFPAVRNRP